MRRGRKRRPDCQLLLFFPLPRFFLSLRPVPPPRCRRGQGGGSWGRVMEGGAAGRRNGQNASGLVLSMHGMGGPGSFDFLMSSPHLCCVFFPPPPALSTLFSRANRCASGPAKCRQRWAVGCGWLCLLCNGGRLAPLLAAGRP